MVYRHDAPEQKSLGDNVVPADPFTGSVHYWILLANSEAAAWTAMLGEKSRSKPRWLTGF
jgi:hypothetical protein